MGFEYVQSEYQQYEYLLNAPDQTLKLGQKERQYRYALQSIFGELKVNLCLNQFEQ